MVLKRKRTADEKSASHEHKASKRPARDEDGAAAQGHGSGTRRSLYGEQDGRLAKLYGSLADEKREVRTEAVKGILEIAQQSKEAVVENILVRLIGGLCTSRKAARAGSFAALVELLRLLSQDEGSRERASWPGLTNGRIIDLTLEKTQPEGKASGQERRDHLYGRVFGFEACITSGLVIARNGEGAPSVVACDDWVKLLNLVVGLAKDVPWLREQCGLLLCNAVKLFKNHAAGHASSQRQVHQYVEETLKAICAQGLAKTPEGVAVWLTAMYEFPEASFPKKIWHKADPRSKKERQVLANVMRENFAHTSAADKKATSEVKSGTAHSSLNFAWSVIYDGYVRDLGAVGAEGFRAASEGWQRFWKDIVDDNLFAASASLQQKHWGLQYFSRVIAGARGEMISSIFTPNLMRCLVNQARDGERYLHDTAKGVLADMCVQVKKHPGLAEVMIPRMLSRDGSASFDQLSKTKTTENLLVAADDAAMDTIVQCYWGAMRNADADQQTAETGRRLMADQLLAAVRSRSRARPLPNEEGHGCKWMRTLVEMFTYFSYWEKPPNPSFGAPPESRDSPVSKASREVFQARLTSILAHVMSVQLDEDVTYPALAATLCSPTQQRPPTFEADDEIQTRRQKAHSTLEKIRHSAAEAVRNERASRDQGGPVVNGDGTPGDVASQKLPTLRAFKLLYSLTLLQMYNGDADAVSVLDDLEVCYEQIRDDTGAGEDAMKLLVELLLTYAAKPSALCRKMAEQVFAAFAGRMSGGCLESMLDVLEKPENLKGQEALFDQDADEAESDGSEIGSDGDDAGSDVEAIEGGSGTDEETDEGTDEAGDGDELAKFEAALAETLGTSRADAPKAKGGESTQDSDSDSDSDMDDEQMMALEPQLEKIFAEGKKKANAKQEKLKAKETMVNFKKRVLDLLQMYVKQQHAAASTLAVVTPLLRLVRTSSSKQVAEKSFKVVKQYFDLSRGSKRAVRVAGSETGRAWETLSAVHAEALREGSKMHSRACSRASLFVARLLVGAEARSYEGVVERYAQTQKRWFGSGGRAPGASFFTEWISWSAETRKHVEVDVGLGLGLGLGLARGGD